MLNEIPAGHSQVIPPQENKIIPEDNDSSSDGTSNEMANEIDVEALLDENSALKQQITILHTAIENNSKKGITHFLNGASVATGSVFALVMIGRRFFGV